METKDIIEEVVNDTLDSILSEQYSLRDADELAEFMWLKPNLTGLNVDIFVDDSKSYQRNNRDLILFVRNGYNKQCNEFLPFTVSEEPVVANPIIDYHIRYNDIFDIQDFIAANLDILIKLANQTISQKDFVANIRKVERMVAESSNKTKLLNEMATLRQEDSRLPMDIWLDEGATYIGHAPRIKFRASREQRNTRQYSSMIISNNPTIENFPKNSPIKRKDIQRLKKFVLDNLDLLLKLANGEIDYVTEFLPNVKL